jgi:hypothetical protein
MDFVGMVFAVFIGTICADIVVSILSTLVESSDDDEFRNK